MRVAGHGQGRHVPGGHPGRAAIMLDKHFGKLLGMPGRGGRVRSVQRAPCQAEAPGAHPAQSRKIREKFAATCSAIAGCCPIQENQGQKARGNPHSRRSSAGSLPLSVQRHCRLEYCCPCGSAATRCHDVTVQKMHAMCPARACIHVWLTRVPHIMLRLQENPAVWTESQQQSAYETTVCP